MSTSSNLASSSPAKPSLPDSPATDAVGCICALSEITNQLLHENPNIRFRCLAYSRSRNTSRLERCDLSFEIQSRPYIFNKAKRILQQGLTISTTDYVENVVRILFCEAHSKPSAFKKYHVPLREHWNEDGECKQKETLRAIRQVLGEITIIGPSTPSRDDSARPELERKSPYSNPQFQTSKTQQNSLLTPSAQPRRTRSLSNPSLPHHKVGVLGSCIDTTSVENYTQAQQSRGASPIADDDLFSISNDKLNHQIPFPFRFRQTKDLDEKPGPLSTDLTENSAILRRTNEQSSFSRDDWAKVDFAEGFNGRRLPESYKFKATLNGQSFQFGAKDDMIPKPTSRHSSVYEKPSIPIAAPRQDNQESEYNPSENGNRCVDPDIQDVIKQTVNQGGYIYVLKAPEYFAERGETPCVKIGVAENVNKRIEELKKRCGLKNLHLVEDRKNRPHHLYKRVEKLAHAELKNFNRTLNCTQCEGKNRAHREWFAVPETVALEVVQRWRDFVVQEPYDVIGVLNSYWSKRLFPGLPGSVEPQGVMEKYDDHEARNKRWAEWLDRAIKEKGEL